MPRPRRPCVAAGAALLAAAAVAAGCGSADRPAVAAAKAVGEPTLGVTTATTTGDGPSFTTTVATTPAASVEVFPGPDAAAAALTVERPGPSLQPPDDPLAFVVEQERGAWLRVRLPVRPNGSTGWIRADGMTMATTALHIEVSLSWFRLKLFDGEDLLLDVPVAVGADATPTPEGEFFTTTLLEGYPQPSAYGIAAFGLSAFSETLDSFAGGPPQVAIHGTYDDAVMGRRVSNGCIRVRNDDIRQLVDQLPVPVGVPVVIAA